MFRKNLKKHVTSSHIEMFVDPPEKTYGKTIHETTSLSCDDPKRIGICHLQHPCDADDAKRLQTAHTCHLMTAVSARRPAAVISQEAKKWRLETKSEPIWWKSENDRVSKSSKKNIPCTSSKGWCFWSLKGLKKVAHLFPSGTPFFRVQVRGCSSEDPKTTINRNGINKGTV